MHPNPARRQIVARVNEHMELHNGLRIRPAKLGDLEFVIPCLSESTSGVINAVHDDQSIRRRLSSTVTNTGLRSCWVCANDEVVVGHALSFDDDAAAAENPMPVAELPGVLRPFRRLRQPGSWYLSSL